MKPKNLKFPLVIDLFAGCGGLSLGFESRGFETLGFEMDSDCCATYKKNLSGDCILAKIDSGYKFPKAKVVIGGPPCQPFSVRGLQKGIRDSRDGFPAFISAIEQAEPDIWMFENVRGLMYKNKSYLNAVISELKLLGYVVDYKLLSTVNYNVPQKRDRVIVVGHRGGFKFPKAKENKFTVGDALFDTKDKFDANSKFLTASMDTYIEKYEKASKCVNPRDLHFDKPARTVTCRNLAGATSDMLRIVLPDGRRRQLTVREGARLQSFPDWFEFCGKDPSKFKQIGNAVPPLFSYYLAKSFLKYLDC